MMGVKRQEKKLEEQEGNVAHIIVTHGHIVDFFARLVGKIEFEYDYCSYCAISAIRFDLKGGKHSNEILMNADSDHVQSK